jgi:hypothetical protein
MSDLSIIYKDINEEEDKVEKERTLKADREGVLACVEC